MFFDYRYRGAAISFAGDLGDAFTDSVQRVSGACA